MLTTYLAACRRKRASSTEFPDGVQDGATGNAHEMRQAEEASASVFAFAATSYLSSTRFRAVPDSLAFHELRGHRAPEPSPPSSCGPHKQNTYITRGPEGHAGPAGQPTNQEATR